MVLPLELDYIIQNYFRETITNFLADRHLFGHLNPYSLAPYSETKPAAQVAPVIVPVFEFELLS